MALRQEKTYNRLCNFLAGEMTSLSALLYDIIDCCMQCPDTLLESVFADKTVNVLLTNKDLDSNSVILLCIDRFRYDILEIIIDAIMLSKNDGTLIIDHLRNTMFRGMSILTHVIKSVNISSEDSVNDHIYLIIKKLIGLGCPTVYGKHCVLDSVLDSLDHTCKYYSQIIDLLLDNDAITIYPIISIMTNINKDDKTKIPFLKRFIERKETDINAHDESNCTGLYYAIMNGSIECVKYLILNDADIDIGGNCNYRIYNQRRGRYCNPYLPPPIILAVNGYICKQDQFNRYLTKWEDDSDTDHTDFSESDDFSFEAVVQNSYIEMVGACLEAYPDLEITDKYGRTALFYALFANEECVEMLLAAGAVVTESVANAVNFNHNVHEHIKTRVLMHLGVLDVGNY